MTFKIVKIKTPTLGGMYLHHMSHNSIYYSTLLYILNKDNMSYHFIILYMPIYNLIM